MRPSIFLLPFLSLIASGFAQAPVPVARPQRPLPAVERVVIISVDGLRPDRLLLADTPNLHALLKGGAYTMWARTTAVSVTLPSHTSMVTGVTPAKHAIHWNNDLPFSEPVYPRVPTVMEMATKAGYVTAMIAGKVKFKTLNKPGTITHAFVPSIQSNDATVAAEAEKIITAHRPGLTFVHFPDVDNLGHAKGWGSPEQLAAIEAVDRRVGEVLASLEQAGVRDHTVVIVTADHGGAGRTHGPEDARSRHIPWIVNGPGVRRGFDLTQIDTLQVNTEDTCATACWLLGLPLPPYFDGKPVYQAFEQKP